MENDSYSQYGCATAYWGKQMYREASGWYIRSAKNKNADALSFVEEISSGAAKTLKKNEKKAIGIFHAAVIKMFEEAE